MFDDDTVLNLSIMIENVEEFGVSLDCYQQLPSSVLIKDIPEPLDGITKTFSFIIGLTNSILSIFDSVTDVMTMIYLSVYSWRLGLLLVINYAAMTAITLCYYIYKIRSRGHRRRYTAMMTPILLLFSWILASAEWMASYLNMEWVPDWLTHNDWTIRCSSEEDNLSIWTKTELKRNQFFLIEMLVESLWQFILCFVITFLYLREEHQTIGIIIFGVSLSISFVVFLSKLVLCSYSPHRSALCFNVSIFLLDILSHFLWIGFFFFGTRSLFETGSISGINDKWGVFMAVFFMVILSVSTLFSFSLALIFKRNLFEGIIIFVFSYIVTIFPAYICCISVFSLIPILFYLTKNPFHFGRYYAFHRKLFDYVSKEVPPEHYEHAMVCINFVLCSEFQKHFALIQEEEDGCLWDRASRERGSSRWTQFVRQFTSSSLSATDYKSQIKKRSKHFLEWFLSQNVQTVTLQEMHSKAVDPWNHIIDITMTKYPLKRIDPKLCRVNLQILFVLKIVLTVGWGMFFLFAVILIIIHWVEDEHEIHDVHGLVLVAISIMVFTLCLSLYLLSVREWNRYCDDMVAFQMNLFVPWIKFEAFKRKLEGIMDGQ